MPTIGYFDVMRNKRTKLIIRILLFVGTITSLFFVPWLLVWAWILPLPDSVQEQLKEAIGHGFDGMIVYVDQADKPSAYYAAGWHNRKTKIPADPHALFKIASISKLYDAVAVSKLVSDGSLSLDNKLADYLPELVGRIENAERITLRMMVQHRSGIPNLTDTPNFWANPPGSSEEALELILDMPANFEPGEDYEYSNTNYLLISQIIEKVVGYSKFQYIKETILVPLGLQNTFGSLNEVNAGNVMSGYHVGHPHDLKMDEHGMLASAEDVGVFLRALNDGSLFSEDEQAIYSSIYVYEHSGWVPGYQSFAECHEDIDSVVIQFYSTTDSKLYMWNLSEIVNSRIVKILRRNRSS
jgi:D-alanyl-D-alanine carboxypeptidase